MKEKGEKGEKGRKKEKKSNKTHISVAPLRQRCAHAMAECRNNARSTQRGRNEGESGVCTHRLPNYRVFLTREENRKITALSLVNLGMGITKSAKRPHGKEVEV